MLPTLTILSCKFTITNRRIGRVYKKSIEYETMVVTMSKDPPFLLWY